MIVICQNKGTSLAALRHLMRNFATLIKNTLFEIFIFCPKINVDKIPTFSRVFHSNLTIFVKSKLSTAKKSTTTTFSRVFHPQKIRQFSREIKVEFLDKK